LFMHFEVSARVERVDEVEMMVARMWKKSNGREEDMLKLASFKPPR